MSDAQRPLVSLFLPTWNAGPEFPEIFRRMQTQELDRPYEIVVIDSGSTDGTVEFLERQKDVRLIRIANTEFNHGLTRNRGIQECRGEIIVLSVQDAWPYDAHWMQRLVDCYEDPEVAGAWSRQWPRPDATPFIRDRLASWSGTQTEPRVQQVESQEAFDALSPIDKMTNVAFDNVSSSVRRSAALEVPFRKRQFGEDLDWGQRAVLAGWKLVFEPRSQVIHSHNNSIWYEFKRGYLDNQNRKRLFGLEAVPTWRNVFEYSKLAAKHLFDVVEKDRDLGPFGKLKWWSLVLPWSFSQNLSQFLGARSVRKLEEGSAAYERLDRILRKGV